MTYKHLTTRELTLIADFWFQGTKAYQAAKLLKRSQETIYRIYRFLDVEKQLNNIATFTNAISVVVVVNESSCHQLRLNTPIPKLKPVGLLTLLLDVANITLAVVCGPCIGCLSVVTLMSSSCR